MNRDFSIYEMLVSWSVVFFYWNNISLKNTLKKLLMKKIRVNIIASKDKYLKSIKQKLFEYIYSSSELI